MWFFSLPPFIRKDVAHCLGGNDDQPGEDATS
jgi:hypothetical protein